MTNITIEPSMAALVETLRRADDAARSAAAGETLLGASRAEWRRRTRAELGLPEQVAIVGSGHQAAFWHPGIAVKSMLAAELAAVVGGAAFHAAVEQDTGSPSLLTVPVRDESGSLDAVTIDLAGGAAPRARGGSHAHDAARDGAAGDDAQSVAEWSPPFDPPARPALAPGLRPALPGVETGIERIVAALRLRRGEPSAPMQVTRAAFDLLADVVPPPQVIRSAAFLGTMLGRSLLAHMAAEPERCAAAYNRAVAGAPGAATALEIRADRVEVPLWRLDERGRRMRAWDDDIGRALASGVVNPAPGVPATPVLRPRALLLTALMRLAACDLFIHGTGGAAYDVAMERWIAEWLGVRATPAAVATATVRLPLPEARAPRIDLDAARRALREARFDPEHVDHAVASVAIGAPAEVRSGSPGAAASRPGPSKLALLTAIEQAPRRSPQRRAAWRALHAALDIMRTERAGALAVREADLATAERQERERPIVESRTWHFPFFEPSTLATLRDAVRDEAAAVPMEPM